jgi:putative DNA primase/helicase
MRTLFPYTSSSDLDGVTPINSLQNTEKYEKKGSCDEWIEGVEPVIDDKTVRIKCYGASSAPLLKILNVPSFILDHYGPTSMGKTFGDQVAISIFGDPKALLIPGNSSETHIEMQATLATDLPLVIDETSLADPVVLTRIVYMINNEGSRGRGTNAKLQEINRWRIVCLTTGEDTIIKTNLNGAGVRAISFNIPMKLMDAGEIETCRGIIENNYGHIIDPYMAKVFQNKDKIKKQFLEVRKHYVKNGQSTALNRMGSYFAIMEIAGSILEDVFMDIGIPQVNPRDIVQVFFDYLTENEQEPPHIKALRHLNDYFNVHASNFFWNDNDLRLNRDTYGYISEDNEYIDVIPKVVTDALKAGQFSNAVIDDFIKAGVIIPGKDRKTFRITLKSDRTQPTVYRFDKVKMAELLN